MTADQPIPQGPRLPLKSKLSYAVAGLGEGMVSTTLAFYLLFFYTDVVGLNAKHVGLALFLGRFWDAISDPLMGQISDRTQTRWGRRRPFLLLGSIPMGLSFLLLWLVPSSISSGWQVVYLASVAIVYNTLHTVVFMPYLALGAEMTADYDERTALMGYRQFFSFLGVLPTAFLFLFVAQFETPAAGYRAMGMLWATVFCLGFTATFVGCRENPEFQTRAGLPVLPALKLTLFNKTFLCLTVPLFVAQWAFAFGGGFWAYIVTYVLGQQGKMHHFLSIIILSTVFFIPIYNWLARRTGKKTAFTINLIVYGLCQATGYLLLTQDNPWGPYLFCAIHGAGAAGFNMLVTSIVADVVDQDELMTGRRREGAYYGIQNLLQKVANSVALTVVGFSLDWIEFVPNVQQTEETLRGMLIAYSLLPFGILALAAVFFFLAFPLTREKSARIRFQLDMRMRSHQM